ncbi:MAG: hypothetical protein KIS92_11010 [Planctomycetota bacterium]|nr:hypothetical protein [Planctomycetota bacterium]
METNQPETYLTKVGRRFKYGMLYMLVSAPIGFVLGAAGGAIFARGDEKAWLAAGLICGLIFARAGMFAGIRRANMQ